MFAAVVILLSSAPSDILTESAEKGISAATQARQEKSSKSPSADTTAPAKSPAPTSKELKMWWDDLKKAEPDCTRAILNFAKHPDATVKFMTVQLKPLQLSEEDLNKLLKQLGSKDEKIWHAAFDELDYLDPRLALGLEELFDRVKENPTRSRLVEVVSGRQRGSLAGKDVGLRRTGEDDKGNPYFNFTSGNGSWWAEARVENLGLYQKKSWSRAIRATVIVESIGTREARALLVRLSKGHRKAKPTDIARRALLAGKKSAK